MAPRGQHQGAFKEYTSLSNLGTVTFYTAALFSSPASVNSKGILSFNSAAASEQPVAALADAERLVVNTRRSRPAGKPVAAEGVQDTFLV